MIKQIFFYKYFGSFGEKNVGKVTVEGKRKSRKKLFFKFSHFFFNLGKKDHTRIKPNSGK